MVGNSEKNTFVAFERALDNGFGIETDVRDYDGKIVISHDLPNSSCIDMQLSHLLKMKFFSGACGRIALNIKSSGLAATVSTILNSIELIVIVFMLLTCQPRYYFLYR